MPISFLLGLPGTDVAPFSDWIKPCLKPSDIVYIGLRDLDVEEKKILRDLGIKCFTMHEVDRLGVGEVVKKALKHVNPKGERPVHLSFDVDACDPSVAGSECDRRVVGSQRHETDFSWAGTGTPVRGGLTFREAHYICEAIAETGCLVGLDIMVSLAFRSRP
jgi:arginase